MGRDTPDLGKGLFGYRRASVNQLLADRDIMLRQAEGRVRAAESRVAELEGELAAIRDRNSRMEQQLERLSSQVEGLAPGGMDPVPESASEEKSEQEDAGESAPDPETGEDVEEVDQGAEPDGAPEDSWLPGPFEFSSDPEGSGGEEPQDFEPPGGWDPPEPPLAEDSIPPLMQPEYQEQPVFEWPGISETGGEKMESESGSSTWGLDTGSEGEQAQPSEHGSYQSAEPPPPPEPNPGQSTAHSYASDITAKFLSEELAGILTAAEESAARIIERARITSEQQMAEARRLWGEVQNEIARFAAWRQQVEPIIQAVQAQVDDVRGKIESVPERIREALAPMADGISAVDSDLADLATASPPPLLLAPSGLEGEEEHMGESEAEEAPAEQRYPQETTSWMEAPEAAEPKPWTMESSEAKPDEEMEMGGAEELSSFEDYGADGSGAEVGLPLEGTDYEVEVSDPDATEKDSEEFSEGSDSHSGANF